MKKNKDGSTLIVTVIIFMFITTVSFAMLSMVSTNYYGRVSESKRTQNLYGSESGLDTSYNIIAKTITAANVYGNSKVQNLKTTVKDMKYDDYESLMSKANLSNEEKDAADLYALNGDIDYWKYYNGNLKEGQSPLAQTTIDKHIAEDNEVIYKLTNKVFKSGFKSFINNNLKLSLNGDDELGSSTNERQYIQFVKDQDMLKQITQKLNIGDAKVYIGTYPGKDPTEDEKKAIEAAVDEMLKPIPPEGENKIELDKSLKIESGYDRDGRTQYDSYSLNFNLYNEEDYKITVTSEFQTNSSTENTAKVGTNLKIIEANYSIRVPNYDEIALKDSVVNVDNKVNQMISSLAIGGDLDVKGINQLNVNGDIFVQGNELTSSNMDTNNRILNKYTGGIKINNDSSSTQKTINFNDNVYTRGTFNIKNNVNVSVKGDLYAKNLYAGDGNTSSNNSQLAVNKNLVVDNDLTLKATNTTINLTDFYGINDKNSETKVTDVGTKVRNSSSIIINEYTKDTENKYGVKITGNAYIMGVAHINTENGYQTGESIAVKGNYKAYSVPDSNEAEKFEYDDPLQVLQVDDDEPDKIRKKEDHFLNYWNDPNNKSLMDCGGVYLNPANTYSIGAIVYNGGNKISSRNYDSTIQASVINPKRIDYAKNIYTISKNNSYTDDQMYNLYAQMGGVNLETVRGLLVNNKTDYGIGTGIKDNTGSEFAMFSSSDKNIVITSNPEKYTNDIVINTKGNKDVNAVIVTNGKIIIDGEINFRGNIIAGGNLEVLENSTVNLSYNEYVTQRVQSSNSEIFNKVFGGNFGEEKLNEDILNIQSNSTNFLKTKLWKIIQ